MDPNRCRRQLTSRRLKAPSMSGIAGIYAYHYAANSVCHDEVQRICSHMAARGPDGVGVWYSPSGRIGFGHRRLNVIDVPEHGAQPMASTDGKRVVTLDGRIYNYPDLRVAFEGRGYTFRTQAEAELLLHLYEEKGEALVNDLRGMFAFGIWDADRRALLLGRDHYGMKPLYYADDGWTFRFASQVKALLAGGSISRSPEPAGWMGFCLFGSVPEPYTTYQEVRALPAGTTLWVDRLGGGAPKQYFSIAAQYYEAERARAPVARGELLLSTHEALRDSVRQHVNPTSDNPIGVFLSGRSNSGALLGLVRDAVQRNIQAISVAFDDAALEGRDVLLAKEIAAFYGTPQVTRVVTEDEFRNELPKILDAMDQPTIGGLSAWFLSKTMRELGIKVAISAIGSDQLFDVQRGGGALTRFPRRFLELINPRAAALLKRGGPAGAYLARRGLFMPWEVERVLGPELARRGLARLNPIEYIKSCLAPRPRAAFDKRAVLDWSIYIRNQLLRDLDWASMAHSVEVRAPFVDVKVLRQVAIAVQDRSLRSSSVLASSPHEPIPSRLCRPGKVKSELPIRWLQEQARTKSVKRPSLAVGKCPWARSWALQIVPA